MSRLLVSIKIILPNCEGGSISKFFANFNALKIKRLKRSKKENTGFSIGFGTLLAVSWNERIRERHLQPMGIIALHDRPTERKLSCERKFKILLVDDSPDYLELFQIYAKKRNLDVEVVSCGEKALEALAQRTFDCLVLDYMLPDLSGREIVEALRNRPQFKKTRNLPVIVISAVTLPHHKLKKLHEAGIQLFLPKSFSIGELLVVVENLCFAAKFNNQERRGRGRQRDWYDLAAKQLRKFN
ncbi:MAG: response regulator [candidate division KSB1 bacterium]|nr:response regulator [candidate division KSB1 bacterium]